MGGTSSSASNRGRWLALTAALLGWMFDGLEMGLFPLAARPALSDLFGYANPLTPEQESVISLWFAVATASFLVGAATGGVLFGWLGDRLGRVRAMTLSVLTYSVFTGLCGFVGAAWQIPVFRFLSALGMGGEWSLGVALVMEIWSNRSRAYLAGLIGAAANVGYLLVGVWSIGLGMVLGVLPQWLNAAGMSGELVGKLTSHSGWRIIMLSGALPGVLTFFIQLFVPESERWEKERARGTTSNWAARDLLGVGIGALGAVAIIVLWALDPPLWVRAAGSILGLIVVTVGYLYPAKRFLQRASPGIAGEESWRPTVKRMVLGACLSGVALLGTWASIQWAPLWADKLTEGTIPSAKAYTQICSAAGAVVGTILGALMGDWLGRRITYGILCLASLAATLLFFLGNSHYGPLFLATIFLAGGLTASFYGWLPLYLPELFPTAVRATGQGFSYNFGRILAAIGVLQTAHLMRGETKINYPVACSVMSLIYLVGPAIIWLAPETKGKPLPE